jgi:2-polyprenyl-6-hydroxyphenyl methylase/3-demethylubiquinone-9 3-methyltransferase
VTSFVRAEPLYDRDGWWHPKSRTFASLRSVSAFRVELLHEWLGRSWQGRTVIDLGCGGGFVAVPLARAGARVVGVDLAVQALRCARRQQPEGWTAVVGDVQRPPVRSGSADLVVLADVIEHVPAPATAVAAAAALVRPGGHLFVNTIARTAKSKWLAIRVAEGLGYVPCGTHRWDWFIEPVELEQMAAAAGMRRVAACGESPRILATLWRGAIVLRKSRSMAMGYAMLFVKDAG